MIRSNQLGVASAISIIVAVITMVSVACIAVNDNISFRQEAFIAAPVGELAINDMIFTLKKGEDGEAIGNILDNMSGVFMAIAAGVLAVTVFVVILTIWSSKPPFCGNGANREYKKQSDLRHGSS